MKMIVPHIERQFQRNPQQHVSANELRMKTQRMKECFLGGSLPLPTIEVITAWSDLPNVTVNILHMSMQTGLAFLHTLPPTPTGLSSNTDDATSENSPPSGSPNGGKLHIEDVGSPEPSVMAFQSLSHSTMSDSDSMSLRSEPGRSSDRQSSAEDSSQSIDSDSPSSDGGSLSSSSPASPTPVGFHNTVNQWLLYYHSRGTEPFVESLIALGAMSQGTAQLASRIAHAVIRQVAKISYAEGRSLESTIRSAAVVAFKKDWRLNDTGIEASSTEANAVSPTPHGINTASLMGSLFNTGISNARDIHHCLSLLSGGKKRFDRLCAMHALLVQANDKLCKKRNLQALMQFQHEITSRDEETGEYVWATAPRAKTLIADILAMIERWQASQALRRDQSQPSSGYRTVRHRVVGPRLRNSTVAPLVACA